MNAYKSASPPPRPFLRFCYGSPKNPRKYKYMIAVAQIIAIRHTLILALIPSFIGLLLVIFEKTLSPRTDFFLTVHD